MSQPSAVPVRRVRWLPLPLAVALLAAASGCGDSNPLRTVTSCGTGADCKAGFTCEGTVCRPAAGAACLEGGVACVRRSSCEASRCVEDQGSDCSDALPCAAAFLCREGVCVARAGGPCAVDTNLGCAQGLVCERDTCVAGVGGPCDAEHACSLSASCVDGVCQARPGERCTDASSCVPGYTCIASACVGLLGSSCTGDVRCVETATCEGGVCRGRQGTGCSEGQPCLSDFLCEQATCRARVAGGCGVDADCAASLVCEAGTCRAGPTSPCVQDTDCTTGARCVSDRCLVTAGGVCAATSECAPALACEGHACVPTLGGACSTSLACAEGFVCEGAVCLVAAGGTCAGVGECAAGTVCEAGQCLSAVGFACAVGPSRCSEGLICAGAICLSPAGGGCASDAQCVAGDLCLSGTCRAPAAGACASTAGCLEPLGCQEGTCRARPGDACSTSAECPDTALCATGSCRSIDAGGCANDAQCGPGLACSGGTCHVTVRLSASASSLDEGASLSVVATLSAPSRAQVRVSLQTHTTDVVTGEYTLSAAEYLFEPGTTQASVTLSSVDDPFHEATKHLSLQLASPSGALLGSPDAVDIEWLDNDPSPTVTFAVTSQSAPEGAGPATVRLVLAGRSALPVVVTVGIDTAASTASSADHGFVGALRTVTIPAMAGEATFEVPLTNDTTDEPDETLVLTLANVDGAAVGAADRLTLTIVDDDAPAVVSFRVAAQTVTESVGTVHVTVDVSPPSGFALSVPLTLGGTLQGGGVDHSFAGASLAIPLGAAEASFDVPIVDDNVYELSETLLVTLVSTALNTVGTPGVFTLTVADNDPAPTVSFVAATSSGREATSPTVAIGLTLSNPSYLGVRVIMLLTGTASSADYLVGGVVPAGAASLTILPGQTTGSLQVTIVDDALEEPVETAIFTMATVVGATASGITTHTLSIADDDGPPVQLRFSVQPTIVAAGATMSPGVEVELLGADGTRATKGQYTIGLGVVSSDALPRPTIDTRVTGNGGAAAASQLGVARFPNVILDRASTHVRLAAFTMFSLPDLNATSSLFDVTAGAWSRVSMPGAEVTRVDIDPANSQRMWAATKAGSYASADAGAHWVPMDDSAGTHANSSAVWPAKFNFVVPQPGASNNLWAGTDSNGLFESTDAGASWQVIDPKGAAAMAFDPQDANVAFLRTPTFYGSASQVLRRTLDGGTTWTALPLPAAMVPSSPPYEPRDLVVLHGSPRMLYVATCTGVFRSADDGATFTAVTSGLPTWNSGSQPVRLVVDPNSSTGLYLLVAAPYSSAAYRTVDGTTWTALPSTVVLGRSPTPTGLAVDKTSGNVFLAGWIDYDGNGQVLRLAPGDTSWTWLPKVSYLPRDLVAGPAQGSLYLSTSTGLMTTTDAGATWVSRNTGMDSLPVYGLGRAGTGMAAGVSTGLWKTSDGSSWSVLPGLAQPSMGSIFSVAATATTWWAMNGGVPTSGNAIFIYRSNDGGTSFTSVSTPVGASASLLTPDPVDPSLAYVGGPWAMPIAMTSGGTVYPHGANPTTGGNVPNAFVADPRNPGTVWVSSTPRIAPATPWSWYVAKTTDNFATLSPASTGLTGVAATYAMSGDLTNPDEMLLATDKGVYRTQDGAATWARFPSGNTTLFTALERAPNNQSVVFALVGDGRAYKSSDAGATWRETTHGLPNQYAPRRRLVPASDTDVWVSFGDAGLFRTKTGAE